MPASSDTPIGDAADTASKTEAAAPAAAAPVVETPFPAPPGGHLVRALETAVGALVHNPRTGAFGIVVRLADEGAHVAWLAAASYVEHELHRLDAIAGV